MLPLVSIVITTKNEEKNIANCLKSIRDQTYKNIEIIVVDYNSTDRTKEIASKYTKNIFDIKKEINLSEIKNFRGAQLNFGVSKSKGEIIFFPDADMTFNKHLILEAKEKLSKVDALYVQESVCGRGFLGKVRNFERSFYKGTVVDAVRFVKKSAFLKAGGFDVKNITFGPDDWDFTKTLKQKNYSIGITKKFLYHHEKLITLHTYLSKKSKYMSGFNGYISKWGKNDKDIKKQFGLRYRFFGVYFEKGKWKKLSLHPLLSLGMYFLRSLIGFAFILSFYRKESKK